MADDRSGITGLVLAGGRGSRMGGIDKGLQAFAGQPLAQQALDRLRPQVDALLLNANRHLDTYRAWGVPVLPDALNGYPGPLAGFEAGLQACTTPFMATVPCDCPRFPTDLVARLVTALQAQQADAAMAWAPERHESGPPVLRAQPVFCLMRREVSASLRAFLASGRRKIDAWTATLHTVAVPFGTPGDDPLAFANANTLEELAWLERQAGPPQAG